LTPNPRPTLTPLGKILFLLKQSNLLMKGFDKIIGEFGLIVKGGQCHAERGQNSTLFDTLRIKTDIKQSK